MNYFETQQIAVDLIEGQRKRSEEGLEYRFDTTDGVDNLWVIEVLNDGSKSFDSISLAPSLEWLGGLAYSLGVDASECDISDVNFQLSVELAKTEKRSRNG